MLELEEAIERILSTLLPAATENVPLASAHRRIAAAQMNSPVDLPPFDNSAVDGYAVRAEDVSKAGAAFPVTLQLRGKVAAGESFEGEVGSGECVRIFTGSPLPRGADAVVMQEDSQPDASDPNRIAILDSVKPWENVRFKGEDLKHGAAVVQPGDLLSVGQVQLLAATGINEIAVGRRPALALLATGSELVEPGQSLAPGKIYESNRLALASLATEVGAVPKIFPLVKDSLAETRAALETALQQADFVVTSGGVSVGEMDFVKQAFEELGGELQFWKVAIRPGRPFVFGRIREKYLFGLPGNPVSAFVTFLLLVRPAIARWHGAREVALSAHPGVLAESLSNPDARRHFMRVKVDATGQVRSAGAQASHVLSSLAAANGLIDVPPKTNIPAGAGVNVLRWE